MTKDIIFKTFRTFRHPYLYDRHTNALVILKEDEYSELAQVERGELAAEHSSVIMKYQQHGLFAPNVVEKIEHYGTVRIEQYLNTRMKQLILQTTTQCNLRCSYCVYSGNYKGQRTHSNNRMNIDTAKKAVDFFLARNNELSSVNISFYGGEPLLEIDLIKQCVEYAKSQVEGKEIAFNITTNGTLLTDTVVDFLVENDFGLGISIDGSKAEHDANRKYANGEGSFDTIIENVKRIRHRYPEYDKKLSFMTTINPQIDLGCVLEYFSTDEVFSDRNIIFNSINEPHYSGDLNYDKNYQRVRKYEYIKMLFSMVGKLDEKYVSPLFGRTEDSFKQKQEDISRHMQLPSVIHPGGPCLPGVKRLFVRTDGSLFPCERVGEMLDFFNIGSLDYGIDIDKVKKMLNIGKVSESECKKCWGLRHCMLCSAQIEFEDNPTRAEKLKACPNSLSKSVSELYELCVLNEFGYNVEGIMVF